MKDKYLNEEGIRKKYDFRERMLGGARTIGAFFGFGYALLGIGSQSAEEVATGAGLGTISLLAGNYLKRRNTKKKQKALKNLENKVTEKKTNENLCIADYHAQFEKMIQLIIEGKFSEVEKEKENIRELVEEYKSNFQNDPKYQNHWPSTMSCFKLI